MLEINLQLFSGGGARSGLGGGGRSDKDADDSNAKAYKFWYIDKDGNLKSIVQRGDTPQEALELVKKRLKTLGAKKIVKNKKGEVGETKEIAKNVISTESSVSDTKSDRNIDLTESPLSYTSGLGNFDGDKMNGVKNIADKIRGKNNENLTLFDSSGNIIYEKEGEAGRVGAPTSIQSQANYDIHNHPRGAGMLGGTFSVVDDKGGGDIQGFVKHNNLQTSFASTKEGIYFISKTDGFKGSQFLMHMKNAETKIMNGMNKDLKRLGDRYNAGRISYDNYKAEFRRINNKALVSMHNEYLKGQKRYGYIYGLIK